MVNQSVNEFYTHFLFKIDALSQDVVLPIDISTNVFNKFSTKVREFLSPKRVQVPPRPSTDTNHQGNQGLVLVINAPLEEENKIRTKK